MCANSDSSSKLKNSSSNKKCSSSNNLSNKKSRKTIENLEATEEEAPSEDGSEDFYQAEFDLIPDYVTSPSDVLSPEVPVETPQEWINKGEKTPHSTRKPFGYK